MENNRTETARDHDDSEIIDNATNAPDEPGKVGRAGGDLQRDVGTEDELARVDKPDTHTRVTKGDEIAHGDRYPAPHTRDG